MKINYKLSSIVRSKDLALFTGAVYWRCLLALFTGAVY
jgi:hypothetical protein